MSAGSWIREQDQTHRSLSSQEADSAMCPAFSKRKDGPHGSLEENHLTPTCGVEGDFWER